MSKVVLPKLLHGLLAGLFGLASAQGPMPPARPAVSGSFATSPAFAFRDAYPLDSDGRHGHALLIVSQAGDLRHRPFTADIRFFNDWQSERFYNASWDGWLPTLPGELALYDSHKRYVGDLLDGGGLRSIIRGG